jgi:uncharacterized coiled-coil protein SlyX
MTKAEMEKRITELQAQVDYLLAWMAERQEQQISYPLDKNSKDIIFAS